MRRQLINIEKTSNRRVGKMQTMWIISNSSSEDTIRVELSDLVHPSDEEQKEESVLLDEIVCKEKPNWICIKEHTDKPSLQQIKQMFGKIVLGNQYEQLNTYEVTEHLEELTIHGTDVEDEDVTII